jgi:hypothetical protein
LAPCRYAIFRLIAAAGSGIALRIAIEQCHLNGQCVQRWEALEPVHGNPRLRYCSQCQAAVHLVEHEAELAELSRLGKNVAVQREDFGHAPAIKRA